MKPGAIAYGEAVTGGSALVPVKSTTRTETAPSISLERVTVAALRCADMPEAIYIIQPYARRGERIAVLPPIRTPDEVYAKQRVKATGLGLWKLWGGGIGAEAR